MVQNKYFKKITLNGNVEEPYYWTYIFLSLARNGGLFVFLQQCLSNFLFFCLQKVKINLKNKEYIYVESF